ncbi:polycystin-1-like [Tubulanus polymorphus]|uniref:polycystin-1-like n=1 Tax=Tubulanus polymorphus TaxID=672921 RepID=UPI003DA6B1E7
MPTAEFTQSGSVIEWEAFAETAGTVKIAILSPNCAGQEYCLSTNKCAASCSSLFADERTCSNTDVFCGQGNVCVPSASLNSCPAAVSRYPTSQANLNDYKIVDVITQYLQLGYNHFRIPVTDTSINVTRGDIIGWLLHNSGVIATRTLKSGETPDFQWAGKITAAKGDSIGASNFIAQNTRYLLRVIASQPVIVDLPHKYLQTGDYEVKVNVSNEFVAGSAASTVTVSAQVGINVSIICAVDYSDIPAYGVSNEPFAMNLLPHTGANVTYFWEFGDGSNLSSLILPVEKTYVTAGEYNISVKAFNKITEKTNSTTVVIQDRVQGVQITSPMAVVNEPVKIYFNLTSGSDYNCNWTMGDGQSRYTDHTTTPPSGSEFSYTYTKTRMFTVDVACANQVSRDSTTYNIHAEERIGNITFDKTGAEKNKAFSIKWSVPTGSNITWTMFFNGQDISSLISFDEATKQGATQILTGKPVGKYNLTLVGKNMVSESVKSIEFMVEAKIRNPSCEVNATMIKRQETVHVIANVSDGSGVTVDLDFKDGSAPKQYAAGAGVDWPGTAYQTDHTYIIPGEYQIVCRVHNGDGDYPFILNVSVYNRIENLTMSSSSPVSLPPGKVDFTFTSTAQYPPAAATVEFDYGDGSPIVPVKFDVATTYSHVYAIENSYRVKANVSNIIDSMELTKEILVLQPITRLKLECVPPHTKPNEVFQARAIMATGSMVTVDWSFDQVSTATKQKESSTIEMVSAESQFSTLGIKNITVTATNLLGSFSVNHLLHVQHPIPAGKFSFVSDAPKVLPPGSVKFTLSCPTWCTSPLPANYPTDPYLKIDYGDGSTPLDVSSPITASVTSKDYTKTYTQGQARKAIVQLYNKVSSVDFTVDAGTFGLLEGLSFVPMWRNVIPLGGPFQLGRGNGSNEFPSNRDIHFFINITRGTPISYVLQANSTGGGYQLCDESANPLRCKFKPGVWNVTISVSNPLSSASDTAKIIVGDSIVIRGINDFKQTTKANELKKFSVEFVTVGTDACVFVDYGESGVGPIESYGNQSNCDKYEEDGKLYFGSNSCVYKGKLTNNLEIKHVYKQDKQYTVKVYGKNYIGSAEKGLRFTVSSLDCTLPVLTFYNHTSEFWKPNVVQRGQKKTITAKVDELDCGPTIENLKTWSMFLVHDKNGTDIREVDVSNFNSDGSGDGSTIFIIKPRSLDIGLYRLQFKVRMRITEHNDIFERTIDTFVRIDRSRLIARMIDGGMNEIVRGNEQFIELSPETQSLDPDMDPSVPQKLDSDGRTRNRTTVIRVSIVQGNPPEVTIKCLLSEKFSRQKKESKLINTVYDLPLKASCSKGCSDGTINTKYKWSLSYMENNTWVSINNSQNYITGITGDTSTSVTIQKRLFVDYDRFRRMRAEFSVEHPGYTKGFAFMVFDLNRAPQGGKCSLTPMTGYVYKQQFVVNCTDWYDEDGIEFYHVYGKWKDDFVERQIRFMQKSVDSMDLPMGADYNGYKMNMYVRVTDYLGTYVEVDLGEAVVRPLGLNETLALVDMLRGNSRNKIEQAKAKGDSKLITTLTQATATGLNSLMYQEAVVSSKTPTNYGPSDKHVKPREPKKITKQQLSKYEQERNDRAEIRSTMMGALLAAPTPDLNVVTTLLSAGVEVVKMPEELTTATQKTSTTLLDKSLNIMLDQAKVATKEQLVSSAEQWLSMAGFVVQGAIHGAYNPTIADRVAAANTPAFHYDTDLDSSGLWLEGNSLQEDWSTLAGEAHQEVQTKTDGKEITQNITTMRGHLLDEILKRTTPGSPELILNTNSMAVSLRKDLASKVTETPVNVGRSRINLPSANSLLPPPYNADSIVQTQIVAMPCTSVYTDNVNLPLNAEYIDVKLKDAGGKSIVVSHMKNGGMEIQSNAQDPGTEIDFKNQPLTDVVKTLYSPYLLYTYKSTTVTNANSVVNIEVLPDSDTAKYLVFTDWHELPNITSSQYGNIYELPHSSVTVDPSYTALEKKKMRYTIKLDCTVENCTTHLYYGIRELHPDESNVYSMTNPPSPEQWTNATFSTNFTSRVYVTGCNYYNTKMELWDTTGCTVSSKTNSKIIACVCTHLTTFAGGWIVAPNEIDISYISKNSGFDKNVAIYTFIIVVVVLYLVAAIISFHFDRKDRLKLGCTPLSDNDPKDKYLYEILVATGHRTNAGTKSKVNFIISGEYDETDVRIFEDEKRAILQRGQVDCFLMSVPRPLGQLNYIRVWHDNSGKGQYASWYLKEFLIRDVQTKEKFNFVCNRWFAVEEDDGQVDRLIPVAGREELTEFTHLFTKTSRQNLSDEHLWFSVVGRPAASRFSRLERLSCCFQLLSLSMMANAMFYKKDETAPSGSQLSLGPFALSPTQIMIGVQSNLVVFPATFLTVLFFRKSRPRKKRPSRISEAVRKYMVMNDHVSASVSEIKAEVESSLQIQVHKDPEKQPFADAPHDAKDNDSLTNISKLQLDENPPKKKKAFSMPWWCRYVGWAVLWISVLAGFTVATMTVITFGKESPTKQENWLKSMVISFVMDVFLTQPIKVFLIALFLSLIMKKTAEEEEEEDDEEDPQLLHDEDWLHQSQDAYGAARPRKIAYRPPDPDLLERAREQRLKEIQMYNIIREIIFYALFLWVLLSVSYTFRDPYSYKMKDHLEKFFIGKGGPVNDYSAIQNHSAYWKWVREVLVPNLRADVWYNGSPPYGQRGFLADRINRIMGYAVMRQLRVKPNTCKMLKQVAQLCNECNEDYSLLNQDEGNYGPGWVEMTNGSEYEGYHFNSSSQLQGWPYVGKSNIYLGGGYAVGMTGSLKTLLKKMDQLYDQTWIDRYTRAVFVEFTVYNPNVNMFVVCTILSEWRPSGGMMPSWRFEPVNLLGDYTSGAKLYEVICQVLFLVFIVYFLIREIRMLIQMKTEYFKHIWNWAEIFVIVGSIFATCIFFYRLIEAKRLVATFVKSKGMKYIKFQAVGYWNEFLGYLIAFLVFVANLKFIRLLRFNKRMSMLSSTLRECRKDLASFAVMFAIVFFAFVQLFYLLFSRQLSSYYSFVTSAETSIEIMLGKFNFNSMMKAEPVLAPLFFFFYVLTIMFIMISMFLTILNDTFTRVKNDLSLQANDHEMVAFMMTRLRMWTGLSGAKPTVNPSDDELNNKKGATAGVSPAFEMEIDNFPEKVEKLLEYISKVYFDHDKIDAILDPGKSGASKDMMKNIMKQNNLKSNAKANNVQNHGLGEWKPMPDVEDIDSDIKKGNKDAKSKI